MFLVGELGAVIDADQKPFNRAMGDVHRKGDRTSNAIKNMFLTAGAAIGAAFVAGGVMAVKTAAEIESLRIQIDTLVGSAKEGERVFENLQSYSAGTPFQLNDLVKGNNLLMGMGQGAEEAFTNLQMLGDVASATGANINELALTFGQASAEGKLMTRDIREFINRGVPLTKLLAESMGVAKNEIFDLAEQGRISYDVLVKAMKDATTGTGIYAGATEKAADSIKGSFSTLKDNASILLGTVGDLIVETTSLKDAMQEGADILKATDDRVSDLDVSAGSLRDTFIGLKTAIGGVLTEIQASVLYDFGRGVSFVNSQIGTFFAIASGATGIAELVNHMQELGAARRFADEVAEGFKRMIDSSSGIKDIDAALGGIVEKTKKLSSGAKELSFTNQQVLDSYNRLKPAMENLPPVDEIFDPSIPEEFKMSLNDIAGSANRVGDTSHRLKEVKDDLEEGTGAARFFAHTLADGLENVLFQARSVEDAIKGILRQLASRALVTGLMGLFGGGFGAGGFLGAMFGGGRAMGGPVNSGKAYLVGEQGPELFMPGTSGSIVPNGGGGGTHHTFDIRVNGVLTGRGTDLEAVISETVRQQGRLG